MEIKEQKKLKFLGIEIPKVNFIAHQRLINKRLQINSVFKSKYMYSKQNPDMFSIVMDVNLNAENYFELTLTAIGHFKFGGEFISDEERKILINANATAIMFPYIRTFITTFTSQLGQYLIEPLIIPIQFFKGELEEIITESEPALQTENSIDN